MNSNRFDYKVIIFQLFLFTFLFVFFTKISPIIPFDGDDWYFCGAMRKPWPMWGVFNPSKVLPEVLEPLGGYMAAFVVYPLIGDYVKSISLVQAGIISICITIFLYLYYYMLKKLFDISKNEALSSEILLLILFFCAFKTMDKESFFGFWAKDMNCYFNYIIPGLLNASTMFFMEIQRGEKAWYRNMSSLKKGCLILLVYFSVFSSIQISIIIAGYSSLVILCQLIASRKEYANNIKQFIKDNGVYVVILALWFFSLFLESHGRRATMLSSNDSFFVRPIKLVLKDIISLFYLNNKYYVFFSCLIVLLVLILICIPIKRSNDVNLKLKKQVDCMTKMIVGYIFLLFLSLIYLCLLYAKTGGDYASRPDATWAILLFLNLLINMSCIIVFNRIRVIKQFIPLIIIILGIIVVSQNNHYVSVSSGTDYQICKEVDDYIINQVIAADKSGMDCVNVIVPKFDNDSNWPLPYNMAGWLQNTLYAHHLIKKRIKITIVSDESVNELFMKQNMSEMESFIDFETK